MDAGVKDAGVKDAGLVACESFNRVTCKPFSSLALSDHDSSGEN
jgi:hypothetical protein